VYFGGVFRVSPTIAHTWRMMRRRAGAAFYLNKNRLLGRSFVPHPRWRLFVETVSFCNLECRFCSYPKKLRPRTVMDDAMFINCIDQVAEMGFEMIAITPITGDIFMDKKILARMAYIQRSGVRNFGCYTNFIGADADAVAAVLSMDKLNYMEISVYGHDLDGFRRITGRGAKQYRRFLDNLASLADALERHRHPAEIVLGFRTDRSFRWPWPQKNELIGLAERLEALGVRIGYSSMVDNWGGDITERDIDGLGMDLADGRSFYKKGACALPFDSVQITATGEVNACACRDPKGTLALGDIKTTPLSRILSAENERWVGIIEDHEAGRFNEVCRACGFYQSIYDERRGTESRMTMREYFARLEDER